MMLFFYFFNFPYLKEGKKTQDLDQATFKAFPSLTLSFFLPERGKLKGNVLTSGKVRSWKGKGLVCQVSESLVLRETNLRDWLCVSTIKI